MEKLLSDLDLPENLIKILMNETSDCPFNKRLFFSREDATNSGALNYAQAVADLFDSCEQQSDTKTSTHEHLFVDTIALNQQHDTQNTQQQVTGFDQEPTIPTSSSPVSAKYNSDLQLLDLKVNRQAETYPDFLACKSGLRPLSADTDNQYSGALHETPSEKLHKLPDENGSIILPVFTPGFLRNLLEKNETGKDILERTKIGELSDTKQLQLAGIIARHHLICKKKLRTEDLEVYSLAVTTLLKSEKRKIITQNSKQN
ncbi:uncharacterized protein LOC131434294 [Malaya genurostris]|uniref:uncharacterized protein LOC131434294 n=1 Tax=Malaya genurostris TaxID=325434 RepID=UPI0026F38245|nr:uncharacterized protein LOC131434294 [Malaya genurostris]